MTGYFISGHKFYFKAEFNINVRATCKNFSSEIWGKFSLISKIWINSQNLSKNISIGGIQANAGLIAKFYENSFTTEFERNNWRQKFICQEKFNVWVKISLIAEY